MSKFSLTQPEKNHLDANGFIMPKFKKTGIKIKVESTFNKNRMLDLTIDCVASGDPYRSIIEMIINSNDEKATKIVIFIEKGRLVVQDNGYGMSKPKRDAYTSVAESFKVNPDATGFTGTGSKGIFAIFNKLEVFTRTIEPDGKLKTLMMKITIEDIKRALQDDGKIPIEAEEVEMDFPYETGTMLIFTEQKPGTSLRASTYIKNLSSKLNPNIADTVTINGEFLKKREIVGETICKDFNTNYAGIIHANIYIPRKKDPDYDKELEVWSNGRICTLREFINSIPPDKHFTIDRVMFISSICGKIDIPSFKHDLTMQKSIFSPKFFANKFHAVLELLDIINDQLAPKLSELLGNIQVLKDKELEDKIMSAIKAVTDKIWGPGIILVDLPNIPTPPVHRPVHPIDLNIRRIEMVCGENQMFYVQNLDANQSGIFQWDDKDSGGKINTRDGSKVIYTAGDTAGTGYQLYISDRENPGIHDHICITLVKEIQFKISPSKAEIKFEQSIILKAINVKSFTQLEWSITSGHGDLHEIVGENHEVLFKAPYIKGETVISCKIVETGIISSSTIKTVPDKPRIVEAIKIRNQIFRPTFFKADIAPIKKEDGEPIPMFDAISGHNNVNDLNIYVGHQAIRPFRQKENIEALKMLYKNILALAYVKITKPNGNADYVASEVSQILAEMAEIQS